MELINPEVNRFIFGGLPKNRWQNTADTNMQRKRVAFQSCIRDRWTVDRSLEYGRRWIEVEASLSFSWKIAVVRYRATINDNFGYFIESTSLFEIKSIL